MESTNHGIHTERIPSHFTSWGNIGAPHRAKLSLPSLNIGLPVWLFSTSVVQNAMISLQSNTSLVDLDVDPLPYSSFVSPSPSSSSLGESSDTSNQVAEKKKKGKEKKKKTIQQGGNQATIALKTSFGEIHPLNFPKPNFHA